MQRRQLVQSPSLSLKALATLVRVCLPFADRIPTLSGFVDKLCAQQTIHFLELCPAPSGLPEGLGGLPFCGGKKIEAKHSDLYTGEEPCTNRI